jgi:uncharacterized membrane protein
MWQVQWMLSLIPDSVLFWFINIILLVGLVGLVSSYFAKLIPFVTQYRIPVQVISILLLIAGVYLKGGYGIEMAWRDKLRVAEEKARVAEQQAIEANNKINTKIVEKVKVVKENTVVYRDRIKEVEKIIDKECKVVPEAIEIHNAAAKNVKLEALKK